MGSQILKPGGSALLKSTQFVEATFFNPLSTEMVDGVSFHYVDVSIATVSDVSQCAIHSVGGTGTTNTPPSVCVKMKDADEVRLYSSIANTRHIAFHVYEFLPGINVYHSQQVMAGGGSLTSEEVIAVDTDLEYLTFDASFTCEEDNGNRIPRVYFDPDEGKVKVVRGNVTSACMVNHCVVNIPNGAPA